VLRRSMQLDLEPNTEQASRLAQAWRLFFKGVNEQTVRNNSAALFLQQSDDVSLCHCLPLLMLERTGTEYEN